MFGRDYSFQILAYFLLVLPSLVSSHWQVAADAQPRWVVLAHPANANFHNGLQEPVHEKRQRSQEEQSMEGLSSSSRAAFSSPRRGRTFESEIQPYPPQEGAGRPLSNSYTPSNPPRTGTITYSEISPHPLQEGAERHSFHSQTPPGPPRRERTFHSEISPHSPEQGAGRPLPNSRTPLSFAQRVSMTHSEITPLEDEAGRLSPRFAAAPSPPLPGRAIAHVGASSSQTEAGRQSPLHSPTGSSRAVRTTHPETTPREEEEGRLSATHSPPGSPRAGRFTPFEIALAQAEEGRLLPASHATSTGSPARAGTTNRLDITAPQVQAQARRLCAPLHRFWNPTDASEERKRVKRMCCKFFGAFTTACAAGPVFANVGPKAGLPMYTAAGVMGLHGFQDMYKFMHLTESQVRGPRLRANPSPFTMLSTIEIQSFE